MKLLFAAISLLFLPTEVWLEDAKASIKRIDAEAKLTKEKDLSFDDWSGKISKYELKNECLMLFQGKDTGVFPMQINQKTYLKNNKIYANLVHVLSPVLYKGKSLNPIPIAVIVEENSYFKNKNEGIAFYREIECFEGQNIDSLKFELEKLDFEKKKLNARDYRTIKKDQKGFKHM